MKSFARMRDIDFFRLFFYLWIFACVARRDFAPAADFPPDFFRPTPVFRWLGLPPPGPWIVPLAWAWKISLLTSAAGLFARFSAAFSFVAGFYLLGLDWSFGLAAHESNLAVIVMGVLAFASPEGDEAWALKLIRLSWVIVYFGAGIDKLRVSGLDFFMTDQFAGYVAYVQQQNFGAITSARAAALDWLLVHPLLCRFIALVGLLAELSVPLIFFKRLRWLVFSSMLLMNVFVRIVLNISFDQILAVYFVWIPWSRVFPNRPSSKLVH